MDEDYEEPDTERIVAEIIKGVVEDDQVGVYLVDSLDEFARFMEVNLEEPELMDYNYVLLRRQGGYIDNDTFTDISGVDVTVFAKTRTEARRVMSEITKRILHSEGNTYLGFNIDFATVLNGPNYENGIATMSDHIFEKAFEFHIRMKWL